MECIVKKIGNGILSSKTWQEPKTVIFPELKAAHTVSTDSVPRLTAAVTSTQPTTCPGYGNCAKPIFSPLRGGGDEGGGEGRTAARRT